MPNKVPRPGQQHPEEWRADLNPSPFGGNNLGVANPRPELGARTAYDVKDLHRQLAFDDDFLKQIPVLPEGSQLEQGATYVDLCAMSAGEFTARGDMVAGPGNCYVPKAAVDYRLWNQLTGAEETRG